MKINRNSIATINAIYLAKCYKSLRNNVKLEETIKKYNLNPYDI